MAAPRGSSAAGGEDASATFLLLYGPLVQFSRPPGAPEPQVVAMPAALPLSVETVFRHPPSAPVPESVAHFCFCPLLKLHEPSELSFCLTDSSGAECFGVSLQLLCRHESAAAPKPDSVRRSGSLAAAGAPSTEPRVRHRPVALVLLSRRPLLSGFARVLRSLAPLVRRLQRLPTTKSPRRIEVRAGRDRSGGGLGLVLNGSNTVMAVRERLGCGARAFLFCAAR